MPRIVVVTGAGAGVGRAIAREFAAQGDWVGLISRDEKRLQEAAEELRGMGVLALAVPADMADAEAVEAAAQKIEDELGPIDVWVNDAMATVFSPVADITAEEFARATQVTYLGTVHGTMSAMKRMRGRNRGTLINIGSALAYRSVPLQAVYCGAKSAIRGFTDSLRCEVLHDKLNIHVTMVHLPAVNTPQFGWAKNRTGHRARPVAPVYQPEVIARAVHFASHSHRREVWVGYPTVMAILANRIAPGLADRYLAKTGYSGQMLAETKSPDAPSNLYEPVQADVAAHGDFDDEARNSSWEMFTTEHRALAYAAAAVALYGVHRLAKRLGV
ncbi:MAG: short-chain dehydrogenase [Rhodospirillales bacterium 20-64-7]|nr:MAG: short-chain dehydrogenase [Rhodospirillales bacterium 20-64-7]